MSQMMVPLRGIRCMVLPDSRLAKTGIAFTISPTFDIITVSCQMASLLNWRTRGHESQLLS